MTQQDFERFLYQVRTWTGIGLIFLLVLQIASGYVIAGKYEVPLISYQTSFFVHTNLSWLLIFFFLTHATVNLRFLFRRWWPKQEEFLVKVLVAVYAVTVLVTLYFSLFK